jgi:predicted amidohydrolase YtcJ
VRCDDCGAATGAASDATVDVTGPWYGEHQHAGDQPRAATVATGFSTVSKRACRLAAVTDNVAAVLGRQPISFDQWAQQNADAFR